MFSAEYFQTELVKQFEELGSATAEIHLHNGTVFTVRKVSAQKLGYVLLEVFPFDGVTDNTKTQRRKPEKPDEVFYDRVAVSYESISYVLLTLSEPEQNPTLGFTTK